MDMDELATPGYATLSPATKSKLASLAKGQLMVRHPHFTQPIFVRFPRPAVMRGRDGAERFPQAGEVPLEVGVLRALRALDPSIQLAWVQDACALHDPDEIVRARNATLQTRPADVRAFFAARLRARVPGQSAPGQPAAVPLRVVRDDDPYAF
jgi:hypothetical protein